MFTHYSFQIIYTREFHELFHVTLEVRQGGALSTCLFAVYLDDLSLELNNIKAGSYIGMYTFSKCTWVASALYPRTLCLSVRGLQSILDVCQAGAESHGIIFNCRKTVV